MADSPLLNSGPIVKTAIFSDGTQLPDTVQIRSITVTRTINRIPTARLVIVDGDTSNQIFQISDTDVFNPGAVIRICAGYGVDQETIFEGLVIKHGLQINGPHDSSLVIECHDKAMKMTVGRENANYIDMTDSDVITRLVGEHSLTADVQSTTFQHSELVQYYCTDWDFLVGRSDANGLLVVVTDGHVTVKEPATATAPSLTVSYGIDLLSFQAELDASSQYAEVQAVSWDMNNQAVQTSTEVAPTALDSDGDLTSAKLADVLGQPCYRLQTSASLTKEELTQWAKAQQMKSSLARKCGQVRFQGNAKAVVSGLIELQGVGKRFSGNVFVTGLTHTLESGDWITEVQFGLPAQWFNEHADVTAPAAAGLHSAVEGLQTGVVIRLDGDPMGEHRVLVSVPVMQTTTEGVWARLLQSHGSSGFGTFFVPEVGDEVVLGYFNNSPSHPVILGSLYSSKLAPPYPLAPENNIKAIVTRCQSKIEFDEEGKAITVTTPGNNKIVISDKGKSIQLHDQNDNKVELTTSGISLTSPKDITVSAKGKISLDAVGAVSIKSAADILTMGLNVTSEAQVAFTAKGSARAELSAAGQTVVKGAMVMIN